MNHAPLGHATDFFNSLLGASIANPNNSSVQNDGIAQVVLPEVSVTATPTRVWKSLPPLKPLPKWDPRVCIGC